MLISRNLILQGFLKSGSKSCKPEVTFAIHQYKKIQNTKSTQRIKNAKVFDNISHKM